MESVKAIYTKSIGRKVLSGRYWANLGWKIVRAVIIMGLCFLILYPFLIKILNSFKPFEDFIDPTVKYIPNHFTLLNITTCIDRMNYWASLLNTVLICTAVGLLQMCVSAVVGYGFARFKFKGNSILFFCVVFTLIVPPQTIILPLFLKFRFFLGLPFLNFIDTPLPVIVLSLTGLGIKNGLYIFMFRQFFKNMPKELEEAAYMDGYNAFQTFLKIMLPSAVATMVTVFLLSFSWQWTDVLYNSLFFKDFSFLSKYVK